MRISCVVLNYNDSDTTIEQVRRICGYPCFTYIVVVDNGSSDGSADRLAELEWENKKIVFLPLSRNGGYGAGNNAGILYSLNVLHMTHVVVANPDTIFTESCIKTMYHAFKHHPEVGVVAACMKDDSHGSQASGWNLQPFTRALLNMGPISRRIWKPWLGGVGESTCKTQKVGVYVDAVHGSMLMVDGAKMVEAGGYDERIFLYEEEDVLAWRMKSRGYRTVLLLNCSYIHKNSVSISKTFHTHLERQKLRNKSTLYYFKQYLKINKAQELTAQLFFLIILFEIWFCANVLKMSW